MRNGRCPGEDLKTSEMFKVNHVNRTVGYGTELGENLKWSWAGYVSRNPENKWISKITFWPLRQTP